MRIRSAAIIVGAAAAVSLAGPVKGDRVDDYIRRELARRHIPGLQLAVLREGKPVKMGYYGLADLEHGVKVRPETLFQIQSMTKSFVAAAVLMLVEEGKVGLDEKLSRYLDGTPPGWEKVTIRHLLSHTSGIKDFINEPTASLRLDVTEDEVLRATVPRPLNFPTGDRYAYSNTNYHLLGMVIRRVTGKPWAGFVDERICKPLGMTHTRVYSRKDVWPNRAAGYTWNGTAHENGEYIAPSILGYAGGGLSSTVEDLAKWDAALYSERLLKRSTLEQAWTSATLNNGKPAGYGFGWATGANNGHRFVSHGGAHMTGFTSQMTRYYDDRLTVIVLTNLRGAAPETIVRAVAHMVEPGIQSPVGLSGRPDPRPDRAERIRAFLTDVSKGVKESPRVVPGLAEALDASDEKQVEAALAGLRSVEFLEERDLRELQEDRNGVPVTTAVCYRLRSKGGPWHFRFWLAEDGRIADYSDRD